MKKYTAERASLKKLYGFSDSDLDTLRSKGWSEERITSEIDAWLDAGYVRQEEAKQEFFAQYGGLLDEETIDENTDVFESFGFYAVPDLTEEERKPPEFIIDGMLPCGMTFLSGAPKIRKSFFALQMAIAVAQGASFFGHETTACDVAYFDLEGSKSRISFRTEHMTNSMPRNLFITHSTTAKLADDLPQRIKLLHQQRPAIRLFIIDTYSRARGTVKGNGANAYDADVSFLEPIQRMAIEENIAIMFVHHDKKGAGMMSDSFERLSGTMGISGSADCVMNLIADGKRFDGKATLEFTPRDAKGGEMKLEFNDQSMEWLQIPEVVIDLKGNPVCGWIIENCPEARKEGVFFSYDSVFYNAYHIRQENPGDEIRRQITTNASQLFSEYHIGVQLGVKSHGERGIRIVNLSG